MDSNVLIVLIVVAGIILVVWLLRDRLTALRVGGSVSRREGELTIKASRPERSGPGAASPFGVDVSGNVSKDDMHIGVARDKARVVDNTVTDGTMNIDVKPDDHTSRK